MAEHEAEGREEKERRRAIEETAVVGAHVDTVRRYGAAEKEHLVAYIGVDRETGQTLAKSLKSISRERISEKQPYQSVKAQAGMAAEVKTAARENAEKRIAGDSSRTARTDDTPKDLTSSDGLPVGGVNNELFVLIETRPDGS